VPLPSSFPLARLVALCRSLEPLGAWLEAARPPVRLVMPGLGGRRLILLAHDLGTLLALTPRVAVWDGLRLRTIAARALRSARRIQLRPDARAGEAARVAVHCPPVVSRTPGDLTLPQPIDCVMEGPIA